jgi:hypothetical protein
MPPRREWTYYQRYAGVPEWPPTGYLRTWRGVAQRLDQTAWAWVPIDAIHLSGLIENGEATIDITTREAIEKKLRRILPA